MCPMRLDALQTVPRCVAARCAHARTAAADIFTRPLTTKFQKPAGPASFCSKAPKHDDKEVSYCQSAAGNYATTSAHTRFKVRCVSRSQYKGTQCVASDLAVCEV